MVFSDILKLKTNGSIEELATYSLPAKDALNAHLHYVNKKCISDSEIKDNPNIQQSKFRPHIWFIELGNKDIISSIERRD